LAATVSNPTFLAIHPTGKFLYVTSKFGHNVWAFRIGEDGALMPIAGSPFPSGTGPNSIAFKPAPETSESAP
jgi:6-phosphogluconolactonase (cycloisomerase 2 family)